MNRRDFLKTTLAAAAGGAMFGGLRLTGARAAEAAPSGDGVKKKILIITGSPRAHGNSNTLADEFTRGARAAGHEVVRFDAGLKNVRPCTACNHCGMQGECILDDDDFPFVREHIFPFVREHIATSQAVLFVSPVYYYTISAQLKAVIDRFYAINGTVHDRKRSAFILTLANSDMERVQPIIDYFRKGLYDYLGWEYAGHVVGTGLWPAGAVNGTRFMDEAYRLGQNI